MECQSKGGAWFMFFPSKIFPHKVITICTYCTDQYRLGNSVLYYWKFLRRLGLANIDQHQLTTSIDKQSVSFLPTLPNLPAKQHCTTSFRLPSDLYIPVIIHDPNNNWIFFNCLKNSNQEWIWHPFYRKSVKNPFAVWCEKVQCVCCERLSNGSILLIFLTG